MDVLIGLVVMVGFVLAVGVWVEAVKLPGEYWRLIPRSNGERWSKQRWFTIWYGSGLLSLGLLPILALTPYFLFTLRPLFGAAGYEGWSIFPAPRASDADGEAAQSVGEGTQVKPREVTGVPVRDRSPAPLGSPRSEYRECPYCAEPIRQRAILCRWCHSDVGGPER